jgi:hypothetical protein
MPRCKTCNEKFIPKRFLQKTCSTECETEFRSENPVKKVSNKSEKRKIQEDIYKDLRKVFLNQNPKCERNNTHKATEVHHKAGRNGTRLNDVSEFMAVCRECHSYIHEHPKEARSKQWIK